MSNLGLGVYITLKDAELTVERCVKSVTRMFPKAVVLDVGSQDSGPDRVKDMGVTLMEFGNLNPHEYTEMRRDIPAGNQWVIWIDADEIWPLSSLVTAKTLVSRYDQVAGFWRNFDKDDKGYKVSSFCHRGTVAWNPDKFWCARDWPNERLRNNSLVPHRSINPEPSSLFCWHAVLLDVSTLPVDDKRRAKREKRREQFSKLKWERTTGTPFGDL